MKKFMPKKPPFLQYYKKSGKIKRLIIIITFCLTLGCATANHSIQMSNDTGEPNLTDTKKSGECTLDAAEAAWLGIIAIETWWWFRIF